MTALLYVFGLVAIVAGGFAFLAPWAFFDLLAAYTGTPNAHLVRDVGAAYIAAGVALCWAARRPARRGPLVGVAATFLVLHALGHVWDLATGQVALSHALIDAVQVFVPAAVTVGLAVYFLRREREPHE